MLIGESAGAGRDSGRRRRNTMPAAQHIHRPTASNIRPRFRHRSPSVGLDAPSSRPIIRRSQPMFLPAVELGEPSFVGSGVLQHAARRRWTLGRRQPRGDYRNHAIQHARHREFLFDQPGTVRQTARWLLELPRPRQMSLRESRHRAAAPPSAATECQPPSARHRVPRQGA